MNRAQDRPEVQSARQAAEALFKPKPQVAAVEAQTRPAASPIPSAERDAQRKPRIFSAPPVTTPPSEDPKPPADSATTQRPRDTRPKARRIPKSAHGRIKTLTTYGMTVEDVAELYGVPVSEIARIVSTAI
jgi:hypothetical protein